jgi:hypothetical protein
VEVKQADDGGATLRVSRLELVRLYNLCNAFVAAAPVDERAAWTEPARQMRDALAAALGRD